MAILCGTDFSSEAKAATEVAGALAARLGERLVLVHAVDLPTLSFMVGDAVVTPPIVTDLEGARRAAQQAIGALGEELGRRYGVLVIPEVEVGRADEVVLRHSARHQTDLMVVGTHGRRGPERWLLGSTAERLTRVSHLPLVVVRGDGKGLSAWPRSRPLRMLVGLDFEEVSGMAGRLAVRLASPGPAELHFAYVAVPARAATRFEPLPGQEDRRRTDLEASARFELGERVGRLGLAADPDRLHILWGQPAEALARLAEEERVDLVLVGTHGRHGLERALLGSVAQGVLRRASRPVCVVPAP